MIYRWFSLPVAIAASAAWAWGIAILQPATQPLEFGSNNTYWVREGRLTLIALALAAFAWAVNGDRRRVAVGGGVALAWVAADVILDRAEISGTRSAVIAFVIAAAALVAGWIAARPHRARRDRTGLILAGAMAAMTAGVGTAIESPTDTETSLVLTGAIVGILGTAVVLGCAWTLRPAHGGRLLVADTVAVALVAGIRLASPGFSAILLGLALAALLLNTLRVHAGGDHRLIAWIAGTAGAYGVVLVLGFPVLVMSALLNLGGILTALAGNPPINAADSDSLICLGAAVAGLGLGAIIAASSHTVGGPRPVADRPRSLWQDTPTWPAPAEDSRA